jgi:hypothetical protein
MIKHIVLLDLSPEFDRAELIAVLEDLDALRPRIDGFVKLDHGPNKNFEGMSEGCAYVLICHFANEDTSRQFIIHPEHNALGQRLVNICRGGIKGITVVDMDLAA